MVTLTVLNMWEIYVKELGDKEMTKIIPSEEIQNLKRANFWLCRDRVITLKVLREKLNDIAELNKKSEFIEYSKLKICAKNRNKLIDEYNLLTDLYARINEDIYQNGKKIMKLRGCK